MPELVESDSEESLYSSDEVCRCFVVSPVCVCKSRQCHHHN
jgi:hypothetical protein